jgi:hypothetical protein
VQQVVRRRLVKPVGRGLVQSGAGLCACHLAGRDAGPT